MDASPNLKLAKAPGRRIFSLLCNRRCVAADSSSCLNGQLDVELITQILELGGEGVRAEFLGVFQFWDEGRSGSTQLSLQLGRIFKLSEEIRAIIGKMDARIAETQKPPGKLVLTRSAVAGRYGKVSDFLYFCQKGEILKFRLKKPPPRLPTYPQTLPPPHNPTGVKKSTRPLSGI